MIDLEKAKEEFFKYVSNYDTQNPNIDRKIYHSIRVMDISIKIAEELGLPEEKQELAGLIGLTHDIARFEQFTIYQTFSDRKSIDHGNVAIQILKKDNYIRKFIIQEEYDNIIFSAIKNHNKFKIEDELSEEELLFAKIIRDADKLDIFYETAEMFWKTEEDIIKNEEISEDYIEKISNYENIERDGKPRPIIDKVVFILTLMFDMNFKCSLRIIKEENYINRILDRFEYTAVTYEKINKIKNIMIEYLDNAQ